MKKLALIVAGITLALPGVANAQDQYMELLKKYAANFETMNDGMAKELMEESMKIDDDMMKLKKDYFKKVSKELSHVEGARFLQVENFVDNLLRLQVQSELPLVQHGVSAVGS
ncbi:MAG: hypothetical protein P8125_04625 [Gemmatimonadota bacterium]